MELRETRLGGEVVYRGKIVNVRMDRAALPDGREVTREVIEHPGGVAVAAVTDNGEILTVRQFRYPMQEITRELPAGKLEPGEDPADCGRRELREETGYDCAVFEPLGVIFPSPGCYGEKLFLYLARELTYVGQSLDTDEFLAVESFPLADLMRQIMNNEIKDSKTIIGIMMTHQILSRA